MALKNANPLAPPSSLTLDTRPNSVDPITQNQNFFPIEAFEFDDPKNIKTDTDNVKINLKDGWKLGAANVGFDDGTTAVGLETRVETNENLLVDIVDDGKLTPDEKLIVIPEWERIQTEYSTTLASLPEGFSTTDYTTAYTNLKHYLTIEISDFMTQNITTTIPDRAVWDSNWKAYYDEYTNIISDRANATEVSVALKAEVYDESDQIISGAKIQAAASSSGSYISLDADKISIGTKTNTSEVNLANVIKIKDNDVIIGDYNNVTTPLGIKWNQDTGTLDIKGTLKGVDGEFNGDVLINNDIAGRYISLGSAGMYAEDSSSNIIHDITDAAVATNQRYLGHLIFQAGSNSVPYLTMYSGKPTVKTWHTLSLPTLNMHNAKGVMLFLFLRLRTTGVGANGAKGYMSVRPYGTSWSTAYPQLIMQPANYTANIVQVSDSTVIPMRFEPGSTSIQFYVSSENIGIDIAVIALVGVYV